MVNRKGVCVTAQYLLKCKLFEIKCFLFEVCLKCNLGDWTAASNARKTLKFVMKENPEQEMSYTTWIRHTQKSASYCQIAREWGN